MVQLKMWMFIVYVIYKLEIPLNTGQECKQRFLLCNRFQKQINLCQKFKGSKILLWLIFSADWYFTLVFDKNKYNHADSMRKSKTACSSLATVPNDCLKVWSSLIN